LKSSASWTASGGAVSRSVLDFGAPPSGGDSSEEDADADADADGSPDFGDAVATLSLLCRDEVATLSPRTEVPSAKVFSPRLPSFTFVDSMAWRLHSWTRSLCASLWSNHPASTRAATKAPPSPTQPHFLAMTLSWKRPMSPLGESWWVKSMSFSMQPTARVWHSS